MSNDTYQQQQFWRDSVLEVNSAGIITYYKDLGTYEEFKNACIKISEDVEHFLIFGNENKKTKRLSKN